VQSGVYGSATPLGSRASLPSVRISTQEATPAPVCPTHCPVCPTHRPVCPNPCSVAPVHAASGRTTAHAGRMGACRPGRGSACGRRSTINRHPPPAVQRTSKTDGPNRAPWPDVRGRTPGRLLPATFPRARAGRSPCAPPPR
jgi:hypothetical protein